MIYFKFVELLHLQINNKLGQVKPITSKKEIVITTKGSHSLKRKGEFETMCVTFNDIDDAEKPGKYHEAYF